MTDVNGKPTNVTTSVNDAKVWLELGYILTEYVTRSQAERIISAKDVLLDIAKQWARDQEDRSNRLQADNAALTARVNSAEEKVKTLSSLCEEGFNREKALETQLAALNDAAKSVEDWWLSEGMNHFPGATYCIFAIRAALEDRP